METKTIAFITDWVNHDATKRAAENWQGSVWVPSAIIWMDVPEYDPKSGMYYVERTRRITPHKFKQHNHG